MKKAFIAFTAAIVAGLSSAVTYNWDNWSTLDLTSPSTTTGGNSYYTLPDSLGSALSYSYTVGVVFSVTAEQISSLSSSDNLLKVIRTAAIDDNLGPAAAICGDATQWSRYASYTTNRATGALVEGENVIGISVNMDTSSQITFTYWVNGNIIGSITQTGVGNMIVDALQLSDVISDSAMVYYTSGIANVPEPTCLALLALGVAGLALRRRA